MNMKLLQFEMHGDERGNLIALEQYTDIPFEMKRIYYIFDTLSDVRRGFHAHKELKQLIICIKGSCKIFLDDGYEKEIVELNSCAEGLYIYSPIWREMFDFSDDAVLIVIASGYYEEKDYIRNYDEFLDYLEGE